MRQVFCLLICVLLSFVPKNASAAPLYLPVDDSNITLTITGGWKYSDNSNHHAIDYAGGSDCVTPILAAASGTVTIMKGSECPNTYDEGVLSFGCNLEISHNDGYTTRYSHLCDGSITVSNGETVMAGEVIAYMGNTGYSTGIHLDFRVAPPGCTDWDLNSNCLVDPYDIYGGPSDYPDDGTSATCGSGYLWDSCPPETNQIPTSTYNAITAKADELWALGLIEYETSGGDMHWYGGVSDPFIIEDWDGGTWGSGDDWTAITFDPDSNTTGDAYVLRHGFWEIYRTYGGPDVFGAPLGDEMDTTRTEYTPHDSYWGTNKISAIVNNCGPTSEFSSVQRFAHATFCWYTPQWRPCLSSPNDSGRQSSALPYCYELTTHATHQNSTLVSPSVLIDPASFTYTSLDLMSQDAVDYIDLTTNPQGYVNPLTGQYRIVFTGLGGDIYNVTSDDEGTAWSWDAIDLSAYYWVPYVRDGISTYPFVDTSTGNQEAVFIGEDGDLWTMTIDGSSGGITSTDASAHYWVQYANTTSDPTGYYDPTTGDLHLVFVDTSQHVWQMILDGSGAGWSSQDLSAVTGLTVYPGTSAQAFMDPLIGDHYVLFTGSDKRIKLLISSNTSTWSAADLTSLAAVDYTISTPVGFIHPTTEEFYVYLLGENERIYEIHYNLSTWSSTDLSAQSACPYGYPGTSLSAVVNPLTGDILVTFQGDNQRINQFRYRNGSWVNTDLTSQIAVEYAQPYTTPQTFIDPFTGAETTIFTGDNARIQVIRFGP